MNSLDFIFNFEHFLPILVQEYGLWIYAILFLIIFSETAFVFMFFLPGDSLLLAVGALCSVVEIMHLGYMISLLFFAAALGYMVNYHIGRHFGDRIFNTESRFIKQSYLQKTNTFFLKHGGKTILLARFIPFARSFAPLAAGSSNMNYTHFVIYNILGALLWISVLVTAGYLFGHAIIQVSDLVES
ncbi:VTT domain-containing protein [Acinetobacter sp. NIPH 2699]|uniref:VTT domain-containing protein n=1 Tax=Acinetobacter sp. NIPH 2699 TaxID=2923433 RepID=UPI001F4BFE47|nr:VTT domain-containing protein [Acinetobacter sp. NIPH 2699]MCH7337888.1 VTT domain-containing protein [Acinetobacter sp. NIPH 2699]